MAPLTPPWLADRGDHNYLVASDLHLTALFDDEDRATDAELAAFLEHYRENRHRGRPWRLILAGDTFDFVYPDMHLFLERFPGPDTPAPRPGMLHWDVGAIAWRLARTLQEHAPFVRALHAFVAAGHSVVLLKGNHDVELQWGLLQRTFYAEAARIVGTPHAEATFRARVWFCSWFWYDPDRLYVEHGSQFDEFNAMPGFMDPALATDPDRAFAPLGTRLTWYLTNAFRDYKPRPVAGAFLQYLKDTGQTWSRKYIGRSLTVLHHSLVNAGLFSEEGWKAGSGREDEGLRLMEKAWGLPVETLEALQALQAVPATAQAGWIYNRFLLDRLFVVAYCALLLGLCVALGLFPVTEPALLALALATPAVAGVGLWWRFQLKKGRRSYKWAALVLLPGVCAAAALLAPDATVMGSALVTFAAFVATFSVLVLPFTEASDLKAHLIRSAARVQALLQVPTVVFGHHHHPVQHLLPDGSQYLNCGAWVATGVTRAHAHVVVVQERDGQTKVSLRQGPDYMPGRT